MIENDSVERAETLREMHRSGTVVLPNAWDPLSARVFEDCGFAAIATTSAGISYAYGYPDGERLTREEMVGATAGICGAVTVPVTADVESGYGESAVEVARTTLAVISAGASGLNIEDATDVAPPSGGGEASVVDLGSQLERIRAVVEAGRSVGVPLVVNARTDIYWRGVGEPERRFAETVERTTAFLDAGADCVFVPGVGDRETISALVREIPGPLNVLAGPGSLSVGELREIGVRRITVGSGPARAAIGLVRAIGEELSRDGTYDALDGAVPYPEANEMFSRHRRGRG